MNQKFFKKTVVALALGVFGVSSALAAVTGRLGHAMPDSHPQAASMNKFVELAA